MNSANDERRRLLTEGAQTTERQVVTTERTDTSKSLVEAHIARRGRQSTFGIPKPEKAPPDVTSWLGTRKFSPGVRQHNLNLDAIDFAAQETEYALRQGMRLEYVAVDEGSRTVAAEVDVFRSLPANSLESMITQELVLDSVDRIRRLATDASDRFVRRALR